MPEVDAPSERALMIRQTIIRLKPLVDSGAVLAVYKATPEDLELLAVIEDELKRKDADHG